MKVKSVFYSILSISLLGVIAKIFGLMREGVVAAYFGTSAQMDAFSFISSVAVALTTIMSSSLANAYLPSFVGNLKNYGVDTASKGISNLLNQYAVFSILLVLLLFCVSPLIPLFFSLEKQGIDAETIVLYSRLMFSTIILSGMSRIQIAALCGLRNFGWLQITAIIYSILSILFTLFLGKSYGVGALVFSFAVNAIVQFFILQKVLFSKERKYSFAINFGDEQIINIWKGFIPFLLGSETYMIGLTIDRTLGLFIGQEGIVSALSYAGLLYGFINSLLTMPVVTVFFTELTESRLESGDVGMFKSMSSAINILSLILLPVAMFLFLTSADFIDIILKRGAFNDYSVLLTKDAFSFYALAAPTFALNALFSRVCIVTQDKQTLVRAGFIFLCINALLGFLLCNNFGIQGVTFASFVAMTVSTLFIYKNIKDLCPDFVFFSDDVKKILVAVLLAGCFVYISSYLSLDVQNKYLSYAIKLLSFCVIYIAVLFVFKVNAVFVLVEKLKNRIG